MRERVREFLEELRENWDDDYWWVRHQELQQLLICVAVGIIGLLFTYLEMRIKRAMLPGAEGTPT